MGSCMTNKAVPIKRQGPIPLKYNPEKKLKQIQLKKVSSEQIKSGFHGWIGALISQDRWGNCAYGSAVLISKDLILTVAHNIYDCNTKCENSSFRFYLAPCGQARQYFQVKPKDWRFPEKFKTCQGDVRYYYDYAIMKLSRPLPISKQPCTLSLMCECRRKMLHKCQLSIYGYPHYKPNYEIKGQSIVLCQYGRTRKDVFHNILQDNSCIQYYISTLPGHSGSPLIHRGQIIGLHFGGGVEQQESYNKGRLITADVMDDLLKWENELIGSPFIINSQSICGHLPQSTIQNIEERVNKIKRQKKIESTLAQTQLSERLDMTDAKLSRAYMKDHINLKELNLQRNNIAQIDLSNNTALIKLQLGQNRLSTINLKHNTMLSHLQISKNMLKAIDLSANHLLQHLDLTQNQLKRISLIDNRKLKRVWLYENKLEYIAFLYHDKLDFQIYNQNSLQCKVDMKYLFVDYEKCLVIRFKQDDHYSNSYNKMNTKLNKYNCKYIFDMNMWS